ncbi:MAG: hypothetical protein J6036_05815 [Clostridia bacterium]|nr:hypothetical protein [Clostridia bacterium]
MQESKLKKFISAFLDTLVIAAILVFILLGLWKMGLLEPPEFLNGFLGISSGKPAGVLSEDVDKTLKSGDSYAGTETDKADLTVENAKKILTSIIPAENTVQDVQFTVYSDNSSVSQRVVLFRSHAGRRAYFISGNTASKQVVEASDGSITVNTLANGRVNTVTYAAGSFDISDEIGAVLTHEAFIEVADEDNYTYSLVSGENGSEMIINFISHIGSYVQLQVYNINLDYGAVVSAKCYENDKLIYSLTTNSISDDAFSEIIIPEQFKLYLKEDYPDYNVY